MEQEFLDAGFVLTDENPDYAVLGFDLNLTYERLRSSVILCVAGVPYIATHPDFNCPIENGGFIPDTGAMIAFVEASTGKRPLVIGKPNRYIIDSPRRQFRTCRTTGSLWSATACIPTLLSAQMPESLPF